MEDNRWGIIYCPKQGVSRSQRRWEHIQALLNEHHVAYDFVQSEGPESVERLAQMLCNNGYHTLIIVGGDSAMNRAVNGLLNLGDEVRERVTLGVIPNGRGNDFASFWEINEKDDEAAVKYLINRRVRKVDVGFITLPDSGKNYYFINCLNVGLVANIMKLKYKTRRIFGLSTLSYFASMLLLIFQRLETKVHLRVNEDTIQRKVMTICVGNCHGYGQTPNAVPYNGMLDVSIVSHPEVQQLFEGLWLLFTGRFLNHKNVKAYRTPSLIHFEDIRHADVSIDGRVVNEIKAPFNVGIKAEHINFIIPS